MVAELEKTAFQQTEVGEIPSDWEVKKLNEVAKLSSGTTPSRALNERYFSGGSHFWVKTMDLNNSAIYETGEKITDTALKEVSSLKVFPIDTVLVAMYGGFNQIGRTGILRVNASINQALTAIQVDNKKVNSLFLLNYLNYRVDYWKDVASSSRKDPNITGKDVKEFPIPLPPTLAEQTAIATALTDADALITQLEKLIAKKKAIKQGAMQELLKPKEGWEEKKLGQVVEKIVGGGTPSRSNINYWGGDIPWITVKDFATFNPSKAQEYITKEGLKFSSSNLIPKGTVITSTRMALGKAVIYEVDVSINQDLKAVFPKSNLDVTYLYYWFEKNSVFLAEMGSGSTVMGLSLTDMKNIQFILPSLGEQTRIAKILSDMDAEIEMLEQRLAKQKMLKQGMMQVLLTGRIRLLTA